MTQEADSKITTTFPNGMKIDGRYEIVSMLGAGGFATVYKARHLMIDREVALKVMDLQKGVVDSGYTERFAREAKIAAKIQHPNSVAIYDFGFVAETEQPYIAMELLDGYDLEHELKHVGPLAPNRAFALFRPVLEALGEGHRLGIVHKDLKPANLYMIDPGGIREQMKVLDFGVARLDSGQVAKLTDAGQLMGTPRYLAPEYIKSQIVTPAIDVYQMALIISEALTAVPAVEGNAYTAMMCHCTGNIQITKFLQEGPVGDVFRRALCIDHTQRYQNCQEFAEALDTIAAYFESNVPVDGGAPQRSPQLHLAHSSVSSVIGLGTVDMQTGRHAGITQNVNQVAAQQEQKKSNTAILIVLAIILVAVIGLVLAFVFTGKEDEPEVVPSEPEIVFVETAPEVVNFKFTSIPPSAKIHNTSDDNVYCETPCLQEFPIDGNWPIELDFVLDDYVTKTITINKESDKDVAVKLEPVQLKFNFTSEPTGADVKNAENNEVLCTTPCDLRFSLPWPKKLEVSLPGHITEKLELNKDHDSSVEVTLKRVPKGAPPKQKPTNNASAPTSAPTKAAPAPTPTPAPAPPQPKPPEKKKTTTIMILD